MDREEDSPLDNSSGWTKAITVEIVLDLGPRLTSLEELHQWTPGSVIALDRALATGVAIRANGRCIGYGEPVNIDGRVGFIISQIDLSES